MGSFEIVTENKSETMKRIVCSDMSAGAKIGHRAPRERSFAAE